MLGVVDDLYTLYITPEFHNVQTLTNILRGDIFLLFNKN